MFCSVDLVVVLWKSLFHGLGCRPMKNFVPWTWLLSYGKFCSVDLVVVLWKSLFHGLGCRPMENSVPWTWLSSYGKVFPFGYHRLGCRLMDACMYMCVFFAIDLIVVLWKFPFPWTWLLPPEGFLVSWTWLSSYERFLDLIKSWD
jgi:hypothetical protein